MKEIHVDTDLAGFSPTLPASVLIYAAHLKQDLSQIYLVMRFTPQGREAP